LSEVWLLNFLRLYAQNYMYFSSHTYSIIYRFWKEMGNPFFALSASNCHRWMQAPKGSDLDKNGRADHHDQFAILWVPSGNLT
jgi:hypothetical protein